MAWLDVKWSLNAWGFNERDDEQGLQFVIVSIDEERRNVIITTHSTGFLSDLGGRHLEKYLIFISAKLFALYHLI